MNSNGCAEVANACGMLAKRCFHLCATLTSSQGLNRAQAFGADGKSRAINEITTSERPHRFRERCTLKRMIQTEGMGAGIGRSLARRGLVAGISS